MRAGKWILTVLILFSAILPVAAVEVGDDAPPFVLTDLNRSYVFSKNIYGEGWVLVDFYATDCVNCNEELPFIEEVFLEYQESGFQVVLLATDPEGASIVKPYFEANPTPIPVLLDRYQKAVDKFGVEALPTIFLVNAEGKVVYKETGYHEGIIDELKVFLDE